MKITTFLLLALTLLAIQFFALLTFGQPIICTCGQIKLWEGVVLGPGNSQHLSDWYTFSHIIHGVIFYGLTRLLFPRMTILWRLLLALSLEVSWEIIENTPIVIEHYRQQALSMGYTGDSIINSISDSLAMVVGFYLAWRLPKQWIIFIVIFIELFLAFEIRDNLTLNIINMIHVFPAIHSWQLAAHQAEMILFI